MNASVLLLTEEEGTGGVNTVTALLESTLQTRGWSLLRVNVRHHRSNFMTLLSLARQSDVLIASNNFLPAYWAVMLGLLAQRPSVIWVHGPLQEVLQAQPVSWLKKLWMRWVCQTAHALVFASPTSLCSLTSAFGKPDLPLTQVIRNPAPALSESPPHVANNQVRLGYVGRLSSEKRPEILLHMMQHLPDHMDLTLVGDGPLRSALEQLAHTLGLMGLEGKKTRIHFAGQQTVDARTYQGWQATLLCSAYEGYPMAALESLAAGTPCVGTPLPALRDMLGPLAPQWIADANDPQALAHTVQKLLEVPLHERQRLSHAIARLHPLAHFEAQWHQLLLKCTRQKRFGPQTVHFVHAGAAYMPELAAYEQHLATLGHRSQRHTDPATVPADADVVWWICGHVSTHHSHRLRLSQHVHEYASASVGPMPALKDRIKRWRHPRPAYRVFLSDWVRQRMGFDDDVPCCLRDMGVPTSFLQASASKPHDQDLVYLGEMSRLHVFLPALKAISQAGLKLLLVGTLPEDLAAHLRGMDGIECTGRIAQSDVPMQLLRARAGLNLMPARQPLNMQTSTKVLEYLAVGLPVLSNHYPWAQQMAQRHPGRIQLLTDTTRPETWTQACLNLPACQSDRSHLRSLTWPERLHGLPIWQALGLPQEEQ